MSQDRDCQYDDDAGSLAKEVQIQHAQDAILHLHAALVVLEMKAVDGVLCVESRQTEAALDGSMIARIQFEIEQAFQCLGKAKVLGRCLRDGLIQLAAHRRQTELVQFLV
jgi:hypothetical protein